MGLAEILSAVAAWRPRHVTVTGGEPLAQKDCPQLLGALCDAGYEVSLETSGALDICALDPRAVRVMDLKTPGSGETDRNRWENLDCLTPRDQVKFVICDRQDYEWAREVVAGHGLDTRCEVLFSPAHGTQDPPTLAEWILEDRLNVRFQVQLHKWLWGEARGR
jgi:7-carboxy-7-deazaguanine synthase